MITPKSRAALAAVAALLGACSSTPTTAPAPAPAPMASTTPAPAPAPKPAMPAPAPTSKIATVELPPYLDPKNELSTGRSVYFDFDKSNIKAEYNGIIERHGKYLSGNPKVAVRIEGNTDERGSAEYNLALGQRRADSVRNALKVYGVRDQQMETVSWGKEKPKATGHDESAWAQNRRADIQYPSK